MTTELNIPVGVYLNSNRATAVVVRYRNGIVWYLTLVHGRVTMEKHSGEKFVRDFHRFLPDYSPIRALRKYRDSGLTIEPDAVKALNTILGRTVELHE